MKRAKILNQYSVRFTVSENYSEKSVDYSFTDEYKVTISKPVNEDSYVCQKFSTFLKAYNKEIIRYLDMLTYLDGNTGSIENIRLCNYMIKDKVYQDVFGHLKIGRYCSDYNYSFICSISRANRDIEYYFRVSDELKNFEVEFAYSCIVDTISIIKCLVKNET